ncbi:hypothetical protein RND71_021356 [Anisodus tanguticus]|uniref:Uncharacterized protein n=1 Tax=Anisodus tanguticus TaxID=243964 RepID=A0AAE1RX08_9SOLA|nr:hypothetical protein RND71_021356 [Anisodus tanguticus]
MALTLSAITSSTLIRRKLPIVGAFCVLTFGLSNLSIPFTQKGCAHSLGWKLGGERKSTSVSSIRMEGSSSKIVPSIVVYVTLTSCDQEVTGENKLLQKMQGNVGCWYNRPLCFIGTTLAIQLQIQSVNPHHFLDLIIGVESKRGIGFSNSTIKKLFIKLVIVDHFKALLKLLITMEFECCRTLEVLFTDLVVLRITRNPLHEKVLEMFNAILPIVREKPSLNAISTCLNLLIEANQIELAKEFLLNVQKHLDLKPNTCIFNILVKYHCRKGDVEAAFVVLEEMKKSRVSYPNLITYSTLMDGLCRCGRLQDALDLFENMLAKDQISPDALTYNILINGFCREGKVDRARKIIEFMRKNGCQPNIVNYTALMNGFCKEGRVGDAKKVFHEMKRLGLTPDIVGYTTLINSFCRAGKVDEGIELLKELKDKRCKADDVTIKIILRGLCRASRSSEAFDMLERLPYDGVRLSKESYRIVLNFLCKEGEVEKAMELLGLMLARRFVPHFTTSNELLVQLCEAGKAADAALALFGLLEMGFRPEPQTWSMLIDVICRDRKLLPAFQLLDELVLQ